MTGQAGSPNIAALRKLEASLQSHLAARAACTRSNNIWTRVQSALGQGRWWRIGLRSSARFLRHVWQRPAVRKLAYGAGAVVGVLFLACVALTWRLSSGPIAFDLATPWLTSAIEQNFGGRHRVEVGGTQLERDEHGRTALRIRDIVVRDADGIVVASAPKAEVGMSGTSLFSGKMRAERLSLVGAEMAVRIEADGKVRVFAGADRRPIATASANIDDLGALAAAAAQEQTGSIASDSNGRRGIEEFAALLAWIDGLGATGLDGHDLGELGLKSGNLVVDDQRSGKRWTFEKINLSLTRPRPGAVVFNVGSESAERPWSLSAALIPRESGRRLLTIDARKVPLRDLMLAARIGEGQIEADLALSGRVRGEIAADGAPHMLEGRLVAEDGFLADPDNPDNRVAIDRAEFSLDWDAARRLLLVPFQVVSGRNRLTLLARLDPPREAGGPWTLGMTGGTIVLAPVAAEDPPLILNRILVRVQIDPNKQRVQLDQCDFGNADIKMALSGHLDFSASDSRLALGIAGNRMNAAALKQLWPVFVAPKVRAWVEEHIISGTVERMVVATNAPVGTLKPEGPAIPDDGLSVEIVSTGTLLQPVADLPPIRDADLQVRITGRTATINLGRGTIELSPGRKLTISNGVFEVPDTFPHAPPARARFRIDGPVPAAVELLAAERLREASTTPLEPATSRGMVSAMVSLGLPLRRDLPKGATSYAINMDVSNFAAERMVMGHKVEAANLRVSANNQGYQIKGDVKIAGLPAALEYRRAKGDSDAEIRVQATLDEAARARLGFDLGTVINGPVPIKLAGRTAAEDRESRFTVEADLTQAKVDNMLPGWLKPAGKPARASFILVNRPQSSRLEDFVIDGSGTQVKGTVEIDSSGDVQSAHFPVFSLSEVDKASLKAERAADGTLKVSMRGEVFDGRGFVKSAMAGQPAENGKRKPGTDLDLDVKIGAVAGFHGEALRGLDLRLSRRAGHIRSFALSGKLGRDTPLAGDLRGRGGGRQVLFFETNDAGALFRFTDTYARMNGGQMWVAMDPPTPDQTPQDGLLNIRNVSIRGEAALDRVVSGQAGNAGMPRQGVEFSNIRVEFTRTPGKLTIREGVVRGPVIGASIDGQIDYVRDDVRMRGTFVPLYGLNNMFGQIPIFGVFLGGKDEGLVGITYEVTGSPGAPVLRVNPLSVAAPGIFRKIFEFPSATPPEPPATVGSVQ
jgi:uncharacterized protein DUF3971